MPRDYAAQHSSGHLATVLKYLIDGRTRGGGGTRRSGGRKSRASSVLKSTAVACRSPEPTRPYLTVGIGTLHRTPAAATDSPGPSRGSSAANWSWLRGTGRFAIKSLPLHVLICTD